MTDSDARFFCLIGDPVEHSVSPAMHSAAFRKLGLGCSYIAFRVARQGLEEAVKGLRALNCAGFNVTIPHKVEVIEHLDKVSEGASLIGAVNTVRNDGGRLTGFNTDGSGAVKALLEKTPVREKAVLLLGAGGAARAVAFHLALENAGRLVIANRTPERAERLASEVKERTGFDAVSCPLKGGALKKVIKESSILINATSVGMCPREGRTPVPADLLHPGLVVMDAVYNPLETRLLREAKRAGAETVDGAAMLVNQGAESLRIWLGIEPPVGVMRRAVVEALGR